MSQRGSAGRRPRATRPEAARAGRSRTSTPRRVPASQPDKVERQTAFTARAAILLLAVASVMVAVALPLKLWLGQRGDIAKLTAATHRTEARLGQLNAERKRWKDPGYVEAQARQRLHYVVPGQKTYIVLGKNHRAQTASARHHSAAATGPWYSQFWQSDQAAGATSSAK
jgi:cell division protein FtsB